MQDSPPEAPLPFVTASETRHIIGHSPTIQRVRLLVARLRDATGSVVITGEPGVGKELVARGLRRAGAPFVTVDAATIACSTAESILFGHERGAFTGAHVARAGLLEQAHGGTLYVDEVANMPLEVQAKLLRALQEKEVTRLGGSRTRRLEFRIVCATNQDLEAQCRVGLFRFDLYTRLSVFTVAMPPLRARQEDIEALFTFFCRAFAAQIQIDAQVWPQLLNYAWPGNVRELSNAAQHAVVMGDEGIVRLEHLPDKLLTAGAQESATLLCGGAGGTSATPGDALGTAQHEPYRATATLAHQLQVFEANILRRAYAMAQGNISQVARALGVDRSSLHSKLRRFGIHPRRGGARQSPESVSPLL